jgi:hypothetical protein
MKVVKTEQEELEELRKQTAKILNEALAARPKAVVISFLNENNTATCTLSASGFEAAYLMNWAQQQVNLVVAGRIKSQ